MRRFSFSSSQMRDMFVLKLQNKNARKKIFIPVLLIFMIHPAFSQETMTDTIRGKVIDETTGYGLINANVIVQESDPILGTATDVNGEFVLEEMPVRRKSLEVRYVGYEPAVIPNILLSSGKKSQMVIQLLEQELKMDDLVITYKKEKEKPHNEMAMASARSISVEETERFAGSLGEPARMMSN